MNKYLGTVVIAPMTSQSKNYPTRIKVKYNNQTGWVIDQIRTIDKQRIVKILDHLTDYEITSVKQIIKETYVD
jgi:mRNA interferase MazF